MKASLILFLVVILSFNFFIQNSAGQDYVSVDGHVYDSLLYGEWVHGIVEANDKGILILDNPNSINTEHFALRNYSGWDSTEGKNVSVRAIPVGTYNWGETPIKLFDYGTTPTQSQMKQINDEAAAKAALLEKEQAEAQKAAQAKVAATWKKSFNTVYAMATNGDAGMQCSLGIRYLNGQGCETNREQAIHWLTESAKQGNLEASNKLVSLQK